MIRKQLIWIFSLLLTTTCLFAVGDVPFQLVKGLIIVEATVNETSGRFIFDTGADETILNHKKLGTEGSKFSTAAGTLDVSDIVINEVTIGKISQSNLEASLADLNNLDEYLGFDIMGILPGSIFAPKFYLIDYLSQTIEVLDKCPKNINEQYKNSLNITHYNGVPLLEAKMDGQKVFFILDSGASANYLDEKYIQNSSNITYSGIEKEIITAGGKVFSKQLTLPTLSFEHVNIANLNFYTLDCSEISKILEKNVAGILSLNRITTKRLLVDIKNGKVYF